MANEENYIQKYKMRVFNEIVRLAWDGNLEDEIENIPNKIVDIEDEIERKIVISYIRMAMGLDPMDEGNLKDAVREAFNLDEIKKPLIAHIQHICDKCGGYDIEKNENCPRWGRDCIGDHSKCVGCSGCINECSLGAISEKIEFMPIIKLLKDQKSPVFAAIAPAFAGQFGANVTTGQIRSALKQLGFADMVEVAAFADVLTIKEAYELKKDMLEKDEKEFFITSCCCPVWINLILKNYPHLIPNVSASVSPMIATARVLKMIDKNAKVVFIGPCLAKKNEAKMDDLRGDVDFVLTFVELNEIFNALDIDLSIMEDDKREEASYSGKIYAVSGGVSDAMTKTINALTGNTTKFTTAKLNGVKECKEGLEKLSNGEILADFIEGMGCIGGCVAGPRNLIDKDTGRENVQKYSASNNMTTPLDNINILQMLIKIGITRVNALDDDKIKNIFVRNFK